MFTFSALILAFIIFFLFSELTVVSTSSYNSCWETSNERKQTISSPIFNSGTDCTWKIVAPVGRVIIVEAFSYEIAFSYKCYEAFLKIYDGEDYSSNNLAELCGSGSKSRIVSKGNSLFLRLYHSQGFSTSSGFNIHYSLEGMFFSISYKIYEIT